MLQYGNCYEATFFVIAALVAHPFLRAVPICATTNVP